MVNDSDHKVRHRRIWRFRQIPALPGNDVGVTLEGS